VRGLDRVTILEAVLPALREVRDGSESVPEAETATARIVARTPAVVAGLPVAAEAFARVGVRLRERCADGDAVGAGEAVAVVGGPLRAITAAGGVALRFLERLSTLATAAAAGRDPGPAGPLEAYAVEVGRTLFGAPPMQENRVRFSLETEG